MDKELILIDRENKYKKIKEYVKDYHVVSLKANIPGINKHDNYSYLLINLFDKKIRKFKPYDIISMDGFDGLLNIYLFNKELNLKKDMEMLESLPLGRFVDIDCYTSNISISRGERRKCYICDDYAVNCMRNNKHTKDELLNHLKNTTKEYLDLIVKEAIDKAMMDELNLDPKFGLVTINSSGSHNDMDYSSMIRAKDAIINYFLLMFNEAIEIENENVLFNKLRDIGKEAEKAMYEANNGVNTYKGLIFDLGLIVGGLSYKLSHKTDNSIEDIIKLMVKGIDKELKDSNSNGAKAYKETNMMGARGEALSGFKNVFMNLEKINTNDPKSLYKVLADIIYESEDTVLYKRCGNMDKYLKAKDMFKDFVYSANVVNKITEQSIKENLSYGGSADLLVCCIFIKYICEALGLTQI